MTTLGPDEISELAECLWDACAQCQRPILPLSSGAVCPLVAAFGRPGKAPFLTIRTSAFIIGFDGGEVELNYHDNEFFKLGRRFREQALSGEGFK